jgi:hypothetical protein
VNEALAALGYIRRLGDRRSRRGKLLRAVLLQAFYSVRSDRLLMERLQYRSAIPLGIAMRSDKTDSSFEAMI